MAARGPEGDEDGRTDRATRLIAATPERLWQAWSDPAELIRWLPPGGMTARVLALEFRPGGAYHMILTYPNPGPGKTTPDSDEIFGRFVAVDPPHGFTQEARFRTDDPRLSGTMRMAWAFTPAAGGTRVEVVATNVPPGISAEDHAAGLSATLAQLARATERPGAPPPDVGPRA